MYKCKKYLFKRRETRAITNKHIHEVNEWSIQLPVVVLEKLKTVVVGAWVVGAWVVGHELIFLTISPPLSQMAVMQWPSPSVVLYIVSPYWYLFPLNVQVQAAEIEKIEIVYSIKQTSLISRESRGVSIFFLPVTLYSQLICMELQILWEWKMNIIIKTELSSQKVVLVNIKWKQRTRFGSSLLKELCRDCRSDSPAGHSSHTAPSLHISLCPHRSKTVQGDIWGNSLQKKVNHRICLLKI